MALCLHDLFYRGLGVVMAGFGIWSVPRVTRLMIHPGVLIIDKDGVERRQLGVVRRRWSEIESIGVVSAYVASSVVLRGGTQKPMWLQAWGMTPDTLAKLIGDARVRWAGTAPSQVAEIDLTSDESPSETLKQIAPRLAGLVLIAVSIVGYLQIRARYQPQNALPLDSLMQWETPPTAADYAWLALQILLVLGGSLLVVRSRPKWPGRSWRGRLWSMAYALGVIGSIGIFMTLDLGSVLLHLSYRQHIELANFAGNVLTPLLAFGLIGLVVWGTLRRVRERLR